MVCRGIFFDLYGTLLLYGDMQAAWSDWLTTFHRELVTAGHDVGLSTLAEGLDGFFERPEPPTDVRGRTLLERRVVTACADLGLHPTNDQVAMLSDAAVNAWQRHVSLDPFAHGVLGRLGPTFRLALVSNFDHEHHVHRVLGETRLVEHFETVVISAEVGMKKPDPRIFDSALRATGLRPDEVVYVGDAQVDVDAARAAGMRPVRIRRGQAPTDTDVQDFRSHAHGGGPSDARIGDPMQAPPSSDGVHEVRCLTELVSLFVSA